MKLPRPLSSAVNRVAQKALGKDWSLYAALLEHWQEIVGPDYAQKTAPVKIVFPHGKKTDEKWASGARGGTLTIRLPQGLAMEFSFQCENIKARVNGFFGYDAIERINLEPSRAATPAPEVRSTTHLAPQEEEALAQRLAAIEDDELRDALFQFGKSVMREGKS